MYLERLGVPGFGILYDTFHANIEEKDPIAALTTALSKGHVNHVHIAARNSERQKIARLSGWCGVYPRVMRDDRLNQARIAREHGCRFVEPTVEHRFSKRTTRSAIADIAQHFGAVRQDDAGAFGETGPVTCDAASSAHHGEQ